jgi:hypothetical protein
VGLDRDPLEPLIGVEVVEAPAEERQRDENGRLESEEERDARLVAAEKEAAARRKARKAKAAEKEKAEAKK